MPIEVQQSRRTDGPSRKLDRPLILRAALQSIDANGAQGLTMRGLGQDLGVEAMSLYRHVSGREDLLEGVVASLLEGLTERLDESLTGTWQGYLQTFAHEVRRVAIEHPKAFPLVATRHPAAPWLRPPLRSLTLVEDFLTALSDFDFTDEQVVATYRTFSSFLLGQLLLESTVRVRRPHRSMSPWTRVTQTNRTPTAGPAPWAARPRPGCVRCSATTTAPPSSRPRWRRCWIASNSA
ncbi:MAG: TetR/AcrR family transcriptional regulator C-terminal domain-containing protein [Microlunatus sp.]|nr:TetR/AcrR family transcriptional regulator C-terminal domain-containing protein [Microlunatus sp.]